MRQHRRGHAKALVMLGLAAGAAGGCTGGARLYTMPVLRNDFPPAEAPAMALTPGEACYWVGDGGRLNVAIRSYAPSLLGRAFETEYLLSLQVEDLPAGSEKLYRLGADAIRILAVQGPARQRAMSLGGVAVVHAPRGGRLAGRLHATLRQQQFTMLTGWAPPMSRAPLIVLAGTFEAVLDPSRGPAILARTEADGLGRRGRGDAATWGITMLYPITTRPAATWPATASAPASGPAATRPAAGPFVPAITPAVSR